MNYSIIQTGSSGNATVIEDIILIDCGISFKKIEPYYKKLKLVLLTHIHSDHFNKSTIKKLAQQRPTLRFGCCEWLVKDLVDCGVSKSNIDVYEFEDCNFYEFNEKNNFMIVEAVPLKHDVPNCGYKIQIGSYFYFYATDTSSLENIEAKDYDMYFVEANYVDKNELEERKNKHIENGEFYYEDRVEKTHLSQVSAYNWLLENMGNNSKYVFMHEHVERKKNND